MCPTLANRESMSDFQIENSFEQTDQAGFLWKNVRCVSEMREKETEEKEMRERKVREKVQRIILERCACRSQCSVFWILRPKSRNEIHFGHDLRKRDIPGKWLQHDL
jgi:hypothetical protein